MLPETRSHPDADTAPGAGPAAPAPLPHVRRRLGAARRRLRQVVLGRRRLLAALCAALAAGSAVHAVAGPPPPTVEVSVATRPLAAGTVLGPEDPATVHLAPAAVPDGAVDDPVGRTLLDPLGRGEPVTGTRLEPTADDPAGDLAAAGRVALPVRLPDAGAVELLAVGDVVDLLASDPQGGGSEVVASGVPVLALPADSGASGPMGEAGGRLVVVGAEHDDVALLAKAAAASYLTYAWSSSVP